MSNMSDQTTKPSKKTRLIIGEVGVDTETGIVGKGHSYDNGNTFTVDDTIYGRIYHDDDHGKIWKGIQDKVKTVVEPAKSAADSAVAFANDAVEKSKVNSQAIDDINSAVSDAKQGANDAMIQAKSAWDAAQSNVDLIDLNYASASASISSARTEAIAAADEAKASASAAQADIVAVRSDVAVVQADVTATRSDVAVAKSAIADTKTSLTSQAKGLSSYAAQASAAGKDITTLKSQAGQLEQDMADTKGDVSQLKVSASAASVALSDATGNISSLQATAKSYSAALSDTNSNVASVTATARDLEAKYADAAGDISQIKTDAKGMTQTISNAQGDITKLKTRADGFDAEFSTANGNISKLQMDASGTKQTLTNAKSDIAVLQSRADGFDTKFANVAGDINTIKADASGIKQTLVSAKGDISTLQSTATGLKNTLTDAHGNISTLQSDVSGLKKTTSDHAGDIATLQASAKTLASQMSSAQGNISTLQQTASGFSSKVSGMETSLADANSKINDITSNGGGRNLLQGTGTASGDVAVGGCTFAKGAFNGYDAVKTNGAWSERFIDLKSALGRTNAKAGDWYTISVYVKADKQINDGCLTVPRALGNGDANTNDGFLDNIWMKTKPITTQWQQYAWSFQINDISLQRQNTRVEYSQYTGDNWIYWAGWMLEKGTVAHDWSPAPEDTDAKITTNSAAIDHNKKAIALKADQTNVDKINGTVSRLQSSLTVQAEQIKEKVTSSQVTGMLTGYATQEYAQGLVTLKADEWNVNLTKLKNDTQTSVTNLSATVDGIKSTVATKADQSDVTQLSNLIQAKVSSGYFTSTTTQLKNLINQRVQVGDVISQINQEAGGNTLIQVSNGKGSLILNADNTIITGKAWIPDAAISSISADKIKLGSSSLYDSNGTLNLVNQSNNLKALIQVKQGLVQDTTQSIISFSSDYNNRAFSITPVGATVTPTLFFERYDQTEGHWLGFTRNEVRRDGLMFHTWDDEGERFFVGCHARFDRNISASGNIYQGTWNGTTGKPLAGVLSIETGNTIWSGSDYLAVGDHVNNSYTNVMAKSFSQQSTLSSKTNIEAVDSKDALDLVNQTDIRSYQYKTDVAEGKTKRYTSLIIDDVNDVSQYCAPDEFVNESRTGRDDGSAVGYLFLAVKELTRRIKILEDKLNG